MRFRVYEYGQRIQVKASNSAVLVEDNWNDWFTYVTLYTLTVYDQYAAPHPIGGVKIGKYNWDKSDARTPIDKSFEDLGPEFFSLGQDESYYDKLNRLDPELKREVLEGLRDLAFAPEAELRKALKETVTKQSLLRYVSEGTIRSQFRRLIEGGSRLTSFDFKYATPQVKGHPDASFEVAFNVNPESNPPTNIHVIIGRNGVGKTRLLQNMAQALLEPETSEGENGTFSLEEDSTPKDLFAGIVSVAFSAFDTFPAIKEKRDKTKGIKYQYVGLRQYLTEEELKSGDADTFISKRDEDLSKEFAGSAWACQKEPKAGRWRKALSMLGTDVLFQDALAAFIAPGIETQTIDERPWARTPDGGIIRYKGFKEERKAFLAYARAVFDKLSSGHKIVLLTVTNLVLWVEEKTLVLIDEPEAHLHPPLLSALVRAVSDLLYFRNGVGIIATHSPVVLQEVPKTCVWRLSRYGNVAKAERLDEETFGEGIGLLTRSVFGLELSQSGYHKLLSDAFSSSREYGAVVRQFHGEMGGEAKAILLAMTAQNDEEEPAA